MLRIFLLLSVSCIITCQAFAQELKRPVLFELVFKKRKVITTNTEVNLFERSTRQLSPIVNNTVSEKQVLTLQKNRSINLYSEAPASITFTLPSTASRSIKLELIKEDITSTDFSYGTLDAGGAKETSAKTSAVHYRGYIAGDSMSIAAISIFSNGEVMGLFSGAEGNYNLGRSGDEYILYRDEKMNASLGFECATSEIPVVVTGSAQSPAPDLRTQEAPLLCRKVRLYWEGDYKLFSYNFSFNLNATTNYLVGLFNQVAVMYLNEGIAIELTKLYIWTAPNSYNNTTSSNGLNSFKTRWNSLGNTFEGDLAVLIDGGTTNNGGVAYLLTNSICTRTFAYGYANVHGSYNSVPTYSWDVEVVTHEMGHMMGSNHTHWCGWNTGAGGSCGAIDDCAAVQTTSACPSCPATTSTNPAPVGFKGTVMSYCHLRSGIGINLANGFGPLPQAAIRNVINNSSCTVFSNTWTGAINTAWENPGNWSCGSLPTSTTDVTIPNGLTNYPVVSSAAVCRKIKYQAGSSLRVNSGYKLSVVGTTTW